MNKTQLELYISEINDCVRSHNLTYAPKFDLFDFRITENIITNHLASSKLTDLILNNYFPQDPIKYYNHFTDINAFENILKTKSIWLLSLNKRFSEDEFMPFYEAHQMNGYSLKTNSAGIPLGNNLVKNAFYISFCSENLPNDNEEFMWEYYAKGSGVRLEFEINELNTDLRKVYYPTLEGENEIKLLSEIIKITQNYGKYLIIDRISTIGFFYLPSNYNHENEHRLLIKRGSAEYFSYEFGVKDDFEYIKVPINKSLPLFTINLTKIIVRSNIDDIRRILKTYPEFDMIPIVESIN